MSVISVRFIGDTNVPQGELLQDELLEEAERNDLELDYAEIIRPKAIHALQAAIAEMSKLGDKWSQFSALILDVRYEPPGEYDGLVVVWDGLIAKYRHENPNLPPHQVQGPPLPWRGIYLSTIYLQTLGGAERKVFMDLVDARKLPKENIFGAAGPMRDEYRRLAQKIIADHKGPGGMGARLA